MVVHLLVFSPFSRYKMFCSVVVHSANVACMQWSCELLFITCTEMFTIDMNRIKDCIKVAYCIPGCCAACAVHVIFPCKGQSEGHFIFQCKGSVSDLWLAILDCQFIQAVFHADLA